VVTSWHKFGRAAGTNCKHYLFTISLADLLLQGQLRVHGPKTKGIINYQTYDITEATLDTELPWDTGLYGGGVWDIILTAEVCVHSQTTYGTSVLMGTTCCRPVMPMARRGALIGT